VKEEGEAGLLLGPLPVAGRRGLFGALKTRLACGFLQEASGFSSFGPSISKTSPRRLDK